MKDEQINFPPFYIGERVVAVDALSKSTIKNGQMYTINSCQYRQNNGHWFWYVGVIGGIHDSMRPTIFASLDEAKMMSFEAISEEVPIHAN